ncbi:hypothetical protein [Yinghuangia soli]|uniref:Uncharacterized protein n=1 Tax=Yinghuangia soli TaxID=2908204 RepID=A0AA41TZW8_9ACTN|nr:hypothetical protein [Yinghuangia soli]MCF2527745.1 hypothetical protein [Yinghuangia soli]
MTDPGRPAMADSAALGPDAAGARFPARAVHGLRATYIKQRGCPSYFAYVVFSAEPRHAAEPGVEARADTGIAVLPHADLWAPEYLDAFRRGFAEALEEDHPELWPDVLLVVTEMRIHEVDSNEPAFRLAGKSALRVLLARMAEEPDFG